jgi:4-aminobutyrate aminotransferase
MDVFANRQYLSPVWARYTDILVERGEGAWLYAVDGRSYLDFTCGIGVTNTGHCHPRVVAAIREQAGLLLHGQANIIYHKPMLELAGALREVVDPALDSFFFSNSGAEAVEGAVKLARRAARSGRPGAG